MKYRIEFSGATRQEMVIALRELADTLDLRVDGLERVNPILLHTGTRVIGTARPLVDAVVPAYQPFVRER